MKTWVKLYTEINRDPDMGTLTWAERGIWSALLALAGEIDDQDEDGPTGFIDTIEKVAWHLRCGLDELEGALHSFIARGMVDVDIDRQVTLINFGKRQRRAPSSQAERVAERVQRHRSKVKRGCNEDVTRRNALRKDSETDTDSEADADADAERNDGGGGDKSASLPQQEHGRGGAVGPDDVRAAHRAWQLARGGAVNALDGEQINDLIDEFTAPWVTEAAHEANASRNGKLISMNFLRAILDRWRAEGFKAPRGDPVKRADVDADKREKAKATRQQMLAQGVPRAEVDATIVEFYGEGY